MVQTIKSKIQEMSNKFSIEIIEAPMSNDKQLSVVDSIIEFCQKQMDNDSSIHKGVYLSIIKFCKEQAKEMQKEQHIKSWEAGLMKVDFNEYYEQTYGGGEK